MKRFWFKLALFFCIWLEIAAELHISADAALVIGIVLWFAGRFSVQIAGQLLGLVGPTAFGLLVQSVAWLALFWWWAPAALWAQPWSFIIGTVGLIAVAGAMGHRGFARAKIRHGEKLWRAHSVAVVAALLVSVALGVFATLRWHSPWPLVGYGLLLYLPFGVGWRLAPLIHNARADARMGSADSFRDAGVSEDY